VRILIDADGCPVVDIAVKCAARNGLECVVVCDTAHVFEKEGARTVTVSQGTDSADFALANMAAKDDIVVTQDYGLAAMCLARGARALNQDGRVYDAANIDALLFSRHAAKKVRRAGGRLKGPAKRERWQDENFERALRKMTEASV